MSSVGFLLVVSLVAALAGCQVTPPRRNASWGRNISKDDLDIVIRHFHAVADTVEPVAERECRMRARDVDCDFHISVGHDIDAPPNAFQTERNGRPYIIFIASLIGRACNREELAFVIGHEVARHIEEHIARRRRDAMT